MPATTTHHRTTHVRNGRWLQLRLQPASGQPGEVGGEVIRKRDQQLLVRWRSLPLRVREPRPRLTRQEHTELNALLRAEAIRRRQPESATTRLARTAKDAAAALRRLGLPLAVVEQQRLPLHAEPGLLLACGSDLAGRPLYLAPDSARAWKRMQHAARRDGIRLLPVSGYRSLDHQAGLVARKLARAMPVPDILRYSALPGRSEHHLGTVLDLHDGQGPALEESFEASAAFDWLCAHGPRFGFQLSYPRDNPWRIGYEPWHWRYRPPLS